MQITQLSNINMCPRVQAWLAWSKSTLDGGYCRVKGLSMDYACKGLTLTALDFDSPNQVRLSSVILFEDNLLYDPVACFSQPMDSVVPELHKPTKCYIVLCV